MKALFTFGSLDTCIPLKVFTKNIYDQKCIYYIVIFPFYILTVVLLFEKCARERKGSNIAIFVVKSLCDMPSFFNYLFSSLFVSLLLKSFQIFLVFNSSIRSSMVLKRLSPSFFIGFSPGRLSIVGHLMIRIKCCRLL